MGKRRKMQQLFDDDESQPVDLLTMTAHELKSPLTLISGISSILLNQQTVSPKRQRNDLHRILHASDRLLALVEGLVAAGKLDNGYWRVERQPVIIGNLLRALIDELAPRLEDKDITVEIDRRYTMTPILADYECLYHVLYNLIDNAIKYSPQGAHIVIKPQREHTTAIIDIENTGKNLKTGPLEQLLEKSTGNTKTLRSHGLGLYIVQRLVEAQQGVVIVNVDDGVIRFRLKLPTVRQLSLFPEGKRARHQTEQPAVAS